MNATCGILAEAGFFDRTAPPPLEIGNEPDLAHPLRLGEAFQITVENRSDENVYLAVLDLSTDESIALVFPSAPGAQEILAARGKWTKKLRTTLPSGRDEVKDILKVFATSTPVDFGFLAQAAMRGPGARSSSSDPLSQRSEQAVRGTTRGVVTVDVESWATKEAVVRVRR
jgi:hypothetical protein